MNIWTLITPWGAQAFRDLLRTVVGPWIVAHGIASGSNEQALLGAFVTIGGVLWGWWTTRGANQAMALLKKLTATTTHADAVDAAKVLPPAAAVESPINKAAVKSVVGALLISFALSLFLAGS